MQRQYKQLVGEGICEQRDAGTQQTPARVDVRALMTLSPIFGYMRGFLKVDREPASRDHFINYEG